MQRMLQPKERQNFLDSCLQSFYQEDLKLEHFVNLHSSLSWCHPMPDVFLQPFRIYLPLHKASTSVPCISFSFFCYACSSMQAKPRDLSFATPPWSTFYSMSANVVLLSCHCCGHEFRLIFLSAKLSKLGQFWSTNILADEREVWGWLRHVSCTLETIF